MIKKIVPMLCMSLFLTACSKFEPIKSDIPSSTTEKTISSEYLSKTKTEDCALCNQAGSTLLPIYAGQNNLGIICINTFDISPISINRYDDYGNLIEEPAKSTSMNHNSFGERRMVTSISPNTDRGYANVQISFTDDRHINPKSVEALLCQNCLNTILSQVWDTPYGIGIINFETFEVKLFEENVSGFSFDDYYIHVDHRENNDDSESTELNLLVFYCPERYK